MGHFPGHVALVEVVGEGLALPADLRVELVERLLAAGLRDVAAIATAADVLPRLPRQPGVRYPVLVSDLAGLEATLAAGATEILLPASGGEADAHRRWGRSVEEQLRSLEPLARLAAEHAVRLRGKLTGTDAAAASAATCAELHNLGCFEVSLEATPDHDDRVARLWEACADRIGPDRLALRLQGRREAALAAIRSLLPLGLQTLDTVLGGLDGLTVATEDVVQLLAELEIVTWVDPDRLLETTWWLGAHLARS